MLKTTLSLNGTWQMGWCPIGQGNPDSFAVLKHLPYVVPGDVHTPLMAAGLMEEPLYSLNSLDCRWVEDNEFWCERRFTLAAEDLRQVMELTFHGLDLTADVYLNGQYIGRHNNAFVEITWPVQAYLREGENTLLVRIDQGLADAQTHELGRMDMMWNNDQPWRSWMRKPQYVYSWDWTIWLASPKASPHRRQARRCDHHCGNRHALSHCLHAGLHHRGSGWPDSGSADPARHRCRNHSATDHPRSPAMVVQRHG